MVVSAEKLFDRFRQFHKFMKSSLAGTKCREGFLGYPHKFVQEGEKICNISGVVCARKSKHQDEIRSR